MIRLAHCLSRETNSPNCCWSSLSHYHLSSGFGAEKLHFTLFRRSPFIFFTRSSFRQKLRTWFADSSQRSWDLHWTFIGLLLLSSILRIGKYQLGKIGKMEKLRRGNSTCPRFQQEFYHKTNSLRLSTMTNCVTEIAAFKFPPHHHHINTHKQKLSKKFEKFSKTMPRIFCGRNQPLEPPQLFSGICRWQFPPWQRFDGNFVRCCNFVAGTNCLTAKVERLVCRLNHGGDKKRLNGK